MGNPLGLLSREATFAALTAEAPCTALLHLLAPEKTAARQTQPPRSREETPKEGRRASRHTAGWMVQRPRTRPRRFRTQHPPGAMPSTQTQRTHRNLRSKPPKLPKPKPPLLQSGKLHAPRIEEEAPLRHWPSVLPRPREDLGLVFRWDPASGAPVGAGRLGPAPDSHSIEIKEARHHRRAVTGGDDARGRLQWNAFCHAHYRCGCRNCCQQH